MDATFYRGGMMSNDQKICDRTNNIRRNAGNPMKKCPVCGGGVWNAYRRIVGGKISEGCVDAFHVVEAQTLSNYANWFNSKGAKSIRKSVLDRLVNN